MNQDKIINYKEKIEQGIKFFNDSRFEDCIKAFTSLLNEENLSQEQQSEIAHLAYLFSTKIANDYFEKKMYDDAFNYYKIAMSYNQNDFIIYLKIAECLEAVANYEMALKCYKEAMRLAPEHKEINKQIGDVCYLKLKDYTQAIIHYEEYIKILQPSKLLGHIYNILGKLYELTNQDIYSQIEYFEKAVKLLPDSRTVIKNLTVVYPKVGRLKEALKLYPKLFDEKIDTEEKVYYGVLQIQAKNFREGWKYYEERFNVEGAIDYPNFKQPKWEGQPVLDKTILVQCEQGLGDTIMFCRYINEVKKYASKIIFRVQNGMYDLMKQNYPSIDVVSESTNIEDLVFDYHISLISLMHYLKTSVKTIPSVDGYLKADEEKIDKYRNDFFSNDKLKIGISWNGAIGGNAKRNIPLKNFYPLTFIENAQVYSFQKGFGAEQLNEVTDGVSIIDLGETFKDFSDTAAAMANLDIFITSDNSVFNLAGAMGVKTILLLNKNSEWRWFLDTHSTPWYSSVKIFKKSLEKNSWNSLIEKAVDEIVG